MNKYLIVASDERSYFELKNVVLELKKKNLPYFFLYNDSNIKLCPHTSLNNFKYDTNVDSSDKKYLSKTLGFELPFKPTVLLITNESWEPEKSILWEFKQWGCFIGCIENSSWIHNNIKTKLEISSRKSFPSNCIDVFFDHSQWCLETKTQAGWWGQKSIITGNPKYDNMFPHTDLPNKNIIIVYGSMEIEHHSKIIIIYKDLIKKYPDWNIFYKPHPSEKKDFPEDFNNIKTIDDQKNFLEIVSKSTHNIGIFSSVMFYPLVMDKNIIVLNHSLIGVEDELNIENFKGHEFDFWKNILNFNFFEEFEEFISKEYIKKTLNRNKKLEKDINKNLVFYDKDHTFMDMKSNNKELLKYYTDYKNDNKSSERIINYIENE
tara:strand:- start:10345 stop:11475 length:1131 start_codon:yes stop_codon:yes gene_type:complete